MSQSTSLLGIGLKERESVPITGAVLHDEDKEGSVQIDALHSYDDALSFSTRDIANQAVYGHGGSDWIRHTEGPYAGMQFYGGEGNDVIEVDSFAVWEYTHNNGPAPANREGVALYSEEGNDTLNGALGDDHIDGGEGHDRLRRGPRYVRQDIQVPLAPSVSRRVIPFAATVLRSGTPRRYRSRVPSLNDSTPSI